MHGNVDTNYYDALVIEFENRRLEFCSYKHWRHQVEGVYNQWTGLKNLISYYAWFGGTVTLNCGLE